MSRNIRFQDTSVFMNLRYQIVFVLFNSTYICDDWWALIVNIIWSIKQKLKFVIHIEFDYLTVLNVWSQIVQEWKFKCINYLQYCSTSIILSINYIFSFIYFIIYHEIKENWKIINKKPKIILNPPIIFINIFSY